MKTFAIFLILVGLLLFLSVFGFTNVTFAFIVEFLFAIVFGIEGVRELAHKSLMGIGGLLFSAFLFIRLFKLFGFSTSIGQVFVAFIASYFVAFGIQMLFRKAIKIKFWEKW